MELWTLNRSFQFHASLIFEFDLLKVRFPRWCHWNCAKYAPLFHRRRTSEFCQACYAKVRIFYKAWVLPIIRIEYVWLKKDGHFSKIYKSGKNDQGIPETKSSARTHNSSTCLASRLSSALLLSHSSLAATSHLLPPLTTATPLWLEMMISMFYSRFNQFLFVH